MQGHSAKVRIAIVSFVATATAVILGAAFWPASGHDINTPAANGDAPEQVDAVEFDGWLYANPETGCLEQPPRGLDVPDVVPVEPQPAPDPEDDLGEHTYESEDHERVPLDLPGPHAQLEPWPACDESRSATTVGDSSQSRGD